MCYAVCQYFALPSTRASALPVVLKLVVDGDVEVVAPVCGLVRSPTMVQPPCHAVLTGNDGRRREDTVHEHDPLGDAVRGVASNIRNVEVNLRIISVCSVEPASSSAQTHVPSCPRRSRSLVISVDIPAVLPASTVRCVILAAGGSSRRHGRGWLNDLSNWRRHWLA